MHQDQVLNQKLQARKLGKKQEKEKEIKQQSRSMEPYRPGSARRLARVFCIHKLSCSVGVGVCVCVRGRILKVLKSEPIPL